MTFSQTEMTVEERSTEFVPVQGGGESTSAGGLLIAAYILMWLFVFLFVWMTSRRLKGISFRVDELEEALNKADRSGPDAP